MKCRHCNDELSVQMIDLGRAPPSNAFNATKDAKETYYPLRVLVCTNCWLCQTDISQFKLNYDELFTASYPYFSSTSPSWVVHAKEYVEKVTERFNLTKDSLVVEVGSNDGYLLQFVKSKCYGIEPTLTGEKAKEKGIMSCGNFFTTALAVNIVESKFNGGKADLMIANNVLAHVPDINNFVRGFAVMLKDDGVATFEFPWLLNLIKYNQFDTVYHEHYSYLSMLSVWEIFRTNGLEVFDVEEIPTHGGSLRVYAQKAGGPKKVEDVVIGIAARETVEGLSMSNCYASIQKNADKARDDLNAFITEAKNNGKSIAGFGAAAKGNTLMNYCGINNSQIDYIVDDTPAKQGKFTPGSHIPIQAGFTSNPDYVLLLPWNFKTDIMNKLSFIREWGGKFVVAIPELEIL